MEEGRAPSKEAIAAGVRIEVFQKEMHTIIAVEIDGVRREKTKNRPLNLDFLREHIGEEYLSTNLNTDGSKWFGDVCTIEEIYTVGGADWIKSVVVREDAYDYGLKEEEE